MREHNTREGETKGNKGCLFAQPPSSPKNAHQRTEQNRSYAPCSSYFSSRNLLSLASLAPFSSMCACVQAWQAERKDRFSLVVSHSSRSLSLLSLTAQRCLSLCFQHKYRRQPSSLSHTAGALHCTMCNGQLSLRSRWIQS
jgi:hypothetical protein